MHTKTSEDDILVTHLQRYLHKRDDIGNARLFTISATKWAQSQKLPEVLFYL